MAYRRLTLAFHIICVMVVASVMVGWCIYRYYLDANELAINHSLIEKTGRDIVITNILQQIETSEEGRE